jgi:snRNA-activating protein complex subunit 3
MIHISDGYRLPQEAAVFIRGPKNSDINTLTEIVSFSNPDSFPCTLSDRSSKKQAKNGSTPDPHSVVVMVSVYNRLTWSYNFVYRSSQHAVLSSNTLAELYNVIPCPSNELPDESTADRTFVGYESGPPKQPGGCVMVIEGTAYGDGSTENDYARYVFLLCNAVRSR